MSAPAMQDVARAVVIERPGAMAVHSVEVRPPGPGEARVRVDWAGLCRSDLHVLQGQRPDHLVRYPIIPGHEWSGHVEAVGEDVPPDLVGRAVVGEGFRACHLCSACRRGETTLCTAKYDETGFTQPGAWSEILTLPARLLHILADEADMRAAAVLEPAAVAGEASLRAGALPGDRVAVVGGGTVGLLACQLLRAGGPGELVVVDPRGAVETRAVRCGASEVVTPERALNQLGRRFDVVIEAAGAPGSSRLAVALARRGGRVVLLGIPSDGSEQLGTQELVTNNVAVESVFGAPPRAWVHTVRAFSAGLLDPGALVTHEMAIDDVGTAFDYLRNPPSGLGKILLHP